MSSASFSSLESLSLADRATFNRFGRGPRESVPFHTVHKAFEATAALHPEAIAVRHYDGSTISYQELDRRANVLANELRTNYGLKAGDRAVLVYSRCIEMVVFIFAVLKAGGQYVPVDGGIIPEDTLRHIVVDSNAAVVLCLPKFLEKAQESVPTDRRSLVKVLALDGHSGLWQHGNSMNPMVSVSRNDGVYVIYTSGTTGKPKGVDVSHGNVTNALLLEPSRLGITVGKNVAQQLNVAFDMCRCPQLVSLRNL